MRDGALFLSVIAAISAVGCAETSACPVGQREVEGACVPPPPACEETVSKEIGVQCVLEPQLEGADLLNPYQWELTVSPQRIESGKEFSAIFRGKMRVARLTLNGGLQFLGQVGPDNGFRRAAVVSAQARVQVREGAVVVGDEPVLQAEIPESCTYDDSGETEPEVSGPFPSCSSSNDLEGGSNADCVGLGGPDPRDRCLPYVDFSTTDDCDFCTEIGWPELCDAPGFCATDGIEIPLEPTTGAYLADDAGQVLFGWAEDIPIFEVGPLRNTFRLEEARRQFGEPYVLGGFEALVRGIPFRWECVMGVESRGSDSVDISRSAASPSPDSLLISCPIQEPQ